MRSSNVLRPGVLAAALLLAATACPAPALSADLDRHYDRRATDRHHFPRYFGLQEPWSQSDERPPRKGVWFYTGEPTRGVNFLVPMWKYREYVRPEPWTEAWFRYCADRWPSFNPKTGTIVTPDGVRMCM